MYKIKILVIVIFCFYINVFSEENKKDSTDAKLFFGINIGAGVPITLITKHNDAIEHLAKEWDADFYKSKGGGTFTLGLDLIKNSKSNVLFGGEIGYSFHGTKSALIKDISGFQSQEIDIKSKIRMNDFRIDPGVYIFGNKLITFIGAGVVFSSVNVIIEGSDNAGNLGNFNSAESGAGFLAHVKLTMYVGCGFDMTWTKNNFYLGLIIFISAGV